MENPSTSGNGPSPAAHHFETFFQEDGKYYFQFVDEKGEAIFFSKGYGSEKSRNNGIAAVIRVAGEEERYEYEKNKKDQCYFVLKSGNHREIGRSALFETEKDLTAGMAALKQVDQQVKIAARKEKNTKKEPKTTDQKIVKRKSTPPKKSSTPTPPEEVRTSPEKSELLPRYKFTLIYYPDSGIWTINNDFSGANKRLKAWDAQSLQQFVETQLPEEDRQSVFPQEEEQATSPSPARATAPEKTPTPFVAPKNEEVRFTIRTTNGEPVTQMAASTNLGSIEVTALGAASASSDRFDARLIARSIDGKKDYVLGMASREKFQNARMLIPMLGAERLPPGLYLFVLDLDQQGQADTAVKLTGRQILMVN